MQIILTDCNLPMLEIKIPVVEIAWNNYLAAYIIVGMEYISTTMQQQSGR